MVTHHSLCLMSRKFYNIIAFVLCIPVSPMLNSLYLIRTEFKRVKTDFPKKYFRVMDVNFNKIFTAVIKIISNIR
jgi:hypothetical protein